MKDHLLGKLWSVLTNVHALPNWEALPVVVIVVITVILWKLTEG